jgi:hypothetical protein
MRDALAALGPAADHATDGMRAFTTAYTAPPFTPELPPATAPHGPGAARQVAQTLADAGHHSHLVADGATVCLSGCGQTPGQVLL